MILEIALIAGIVIITLAYFRKLSPWNNVSMRLGLILVIVSIIIFASVPLTTMETVSDWEVSPQPTDTSGWGQTSGSWNSDYSILTVPIILHSNSNYKYNNTRVPFYITPNTPTGSNIHDYSTINIEITNYSTKVSDYSLLKHTKGAYWANITDPDGVSSGDSYLCVYNFKYMQQGTFYVDFKLNPGSAELADVGESASVYVHIYDHKNFHNVYEIKFICVG